MNRIALGHKQVLAKSSLGPITAIRVWDIFVSIRI